MATRAQLKAFFETGDYPTQGQFATLIDAFFIKNADDITIADVTGLIDALAGKGSAAAVQNAYDNALAAKTSVDAVLAGAPAEGDTLSKLYDLIMEILSLPVGGTTGQILAKVDNADGNVEWIDAPPGGGGGVVNKEAKGLLVTPTFDLHGDSIAGGEASSIGANSFASVFGRLAYVAPISRSIYGSGIRDVIKSRFINAPVINGKNFLLVAIGTNDIRNSNSSSTPNKVREGVKTVLANQFLNKAISVSNSAITKTGTWANLTTANICSKSVISLSGSPMSTSTAGDTLTFPHFGDNIVIGTWGVDASHTAFGRFSVTVDGVDHGTFDMKNKADDWYLTSIDTFDIRMPNVFVLKLTSGLHSVVITALDNLEIDIDYIGMMGNPNTVPAAVIGHIIYSNASGYAQSPGYSSDAKVKVTNDAIDEAVQEFINMDYPVNVAKTENYLDVTTAFAGSDGLHPNDSGHAQMAMAYLDTLYHLSYYKSYMQDTMRVVTSNTNYNNTTGAAVIVDNIDGSGQNISVDILGGALKGKRRVDSSGTTTYVAFGGGGGHSFYVGGDFGAGQEVFNIGGDGVTVAKHYTLFDLNTAPASATAAGAKGDIRITADYIYVCIAPNTWVRTALLTW